MGATATRTGEAAAAITAILTRTRTTMDTVTKILDMVTVTRTLGVTDTVTEVEILRSWKG